MDTSQQAPQQHFLWGCLSPCDLGWGGSLRVIRGGGLPLRVIQGGGLPLRVIRGGGALSV